ncbi:hypothetical protein CP533_4061 [Ophiocordyceps camponoti-saundersi (nom. inval.)]|nr:hypothetical protein CP533_4061 [Ophiocordyceps camponoti-saundersi (nom. inval.)]
MPPPPPQPPPLSLAAPSTDDDDAGVVPPPPMSPITPTLTPAYLADVTPQQPLPSPISRLPIYTHAKQTDQVAVSPPPPESIDFDTNTDVLALRSAISVLQVQKKRAAADIQSLSSARDAALDDADAFVRDLASGKVNNASAAAGADDAKPWTSLPRPQEVVRCPPINWSQYAVVGDSLDKLHADEVRRPSQGIPATVGPDGSYEFRGEGPRETYPGVATPFAPGKDRIDRKPKAKN